MLLVESLLDLVVRTVTDVDVTEEPAIGGVVVTGLLASLLWTDEETALPIFPVSVLCCVVTVVVSKTEEGKVVGSLESSPCKEFPGNNDSSGQLVIVVVPVWTEVCVRCSVNTPCPDLDTVSCSSVEVSGRGTLVDTTDLEDKTTPEGKLIIGAGVYSNELPILVFEEYWTV